MASLRVLKKLSIRSLGGGATRAVERLLPKQRVEGSNPFSRSNFATVAVWSHRARCLDGEPAGSAAEVEHALTGRDAGALEQERSADARDHAV